MAGAEVGYVVYRPSADEPWAWSDEGDNRDAASKAFGANGRPLFDPQFLLLAGGLIFHYDQTVENVTVPSSSSFDRTVGCLYGGAGIDVQIGCDGRVPLVQDLRIYANAGVGPSIPDADIIWLLRAGIAFMINENIGVEFGYRLFDFDMQDGPSTVDAGLRGLFGGVSVRF
jgi:opacity protein-like surface antigen